MISSLTHHGSLIGVGKAIGEDGFNRYKEEVSNFVEGTIKRMRGNRHTDRNIMIFQSRLVSLFINRLSVNKLKVKDLPENH
jgi:hypothetical protein